MCAKSPRIALLGEVEDDLLGAVDELGRLADPLAAEPRDLLPGLDERPEGRRLLDDLRIVVDVGRRRHERRELGDAGAAPDLLDLAALLQLVRERDRVDGLALRPEREHRAVDRPVRPTVEVGGVEDLRDGPDGRLGEEHRAEHRLLGLEVLRRHERRRGSMRRAHGAGLKPSPAGVSNSTGPDERRRKSAR